MRLASWHATQDVGRSEAHKTADMDKLIAEHIAAERTGDSAASVAMYTDDVEHDVPGSPIGPVVGKVAAQGFYDYLFNQIQTEVMDLTHSYSGDSFCVQEHLWTGTVPGEFMGLPGHGRRISSGFSMLGSSVTVL